MLLTLPIHHNNPRHPHTHQNRHNYHRKNLLHPHNPLHYIRHKEQDHGRCMCPYRYVWKCDGDCIGCEYHAAGDTLSLDVPNTDGNGSMYDYLPKNKRPMQEVITDRMLLEALFNRLRQLDPEADTIIQLWKEHPEGISDRAIARALGRPQKTFADQMKKYRTDLRRITGDK